MSATIQPVIRRLTATVTAAQFQRANVGRKKVFVRNRGSASAFFTMASGDAATAGFELPSGRHLKLEGKAAAMDLWVLTGSGTADLAIWEGELAEITPQGDAGASALNGLSQFQFYLAGGQTTGAKKLAALVGVAGTIVDVRAHLDTAPTTTSFILDVNINGTTAFTTQGNRPTIAATATDSSTTLPDVVALAAGDRLTVDCDQIGSGTAGSDLYVTVTVKRALT